jgi:hypothetical protein
MTSLVILSVVFCISFGVITTVAWREVSRSSDKRIR